MSKIPVYTIDTGVPIPEKRKSLSILGKMNVGDSIIVPLKSRNSVATAASISKRKTGKEFITKKVDDAQVRVWRTK